MKYITINAETYEEALKKAREQYGDRLRIHSRKDLSRPGFLGIGKVKSCELTCFVNEAQDNTGNSNTSDEEKLLKRFEKEAETPSPEKAKEDEVRPLIDRTEQILNFNEFSKTFSESIVSAVKNDLIKALPDKPDEKQLELIVLDKISSSYEIDSDTQRKPPKYSVILGPTGTGKTTTVAKISAMYGVLSAVKGDVRIITLDSYRIGAFEQIESFGKSLGVPVYKVSDKKDFAAALDECRNSDLVLIDTMGKSPRDGLLADRLSTLLSLCPHEETGFFVAINASMKTTDIEMALREFGEYRPKSMIITKVDETFAIGNILSICSKYKLPVLYVTDGQKVPSNIHRATNSYLMSLIRGLSTDISRLGLSN